MWWSSQQLGLFVCLPAVVQAAMNYVGCFASPGGLVDIGPSIYQSRGLCLNRCRQIDQWVIGLTNGTHCLCGSRVPPTYDLVDDGHCNIRCPGYAQEKCGGRGYISVLVREIQLQQQQQQRAGDAGSTSGSLHGNLAAGSL